LHCGQYWICSGLTCKWLRRLPCRALEVRLFGTAMMGLPLLVLSEVKLAMVGVAHGDVKLS
jgi:hypothetical protein